MIRKIGFALIWLGFSVYAFTMAPPAQPDTFDLIVNLSTGNWEGINPLIVSLFNLMGVWPTIYACLVLIDGAGQKVLAWPFVVASFGVGAFAILPYMALRDRNTSFEGSKSRLLAVLDSVWTGRVLLLGAIALLNMPRGEDPPFGAPIFIVTVVYPGTSPADMEQLVVDPLEDE